MTTPSDNKNHEGGFSSFTVGLALGVVVTLLLGTEEGRKLVKKAVDAIPSKYKTPSVLTRSRLLSTSLPPTEETSHHASFEAPPRPAPHVRPSRPEPFTPSL